MHVYVSMYVRSYVPTCLYIGCTRSASLWNVEVYIYIYIYIYMYIYTYVCV